MSNKRALLSNKRPLSTNKRALLPKTRICWNFNVQFPKLRLVFQEKNREKVFLLQIYPFLYEITLSTCYISRTFASEFINDWIKVSKYFVFIKSKNCFVRSGSGNISVHTILKKKRLFQDSRRSTFLSSVEWTSRGRGKISSCYDFIVSINYYINI